MTLLSVSGIAKSFAGVHALRGVSFDLLPGEVHALVGENGAGKSTLIKVMTGAHRPDAGRIEMEGQEVVHNTPERSRALGIAAIYQQPALFPELSVAENMALGFESGGLWRRIDWTARRTRAKVLIMDEPTASLPEHEVGNLFRVVRELKAQGVGIIYISHRLDELYALADRVTVLRDGQSVATRPMKEVERPELIRLMVGREISAIFPKREVKQGDVVLETRGLECRASGIRGVSLSIRAGEILGLAGLVGAGRTELARVLFGLTPATGGQILLGGAPVSVRRPSDAVELGIAYVPEDRRRHGVILELPIAANTTLAILRRISKGGFLDFGRENALAASYVEKLAVKTPSIQTPAGNLSGGNQQKVALSRWLATEPKVLILDEPTQGIDVGAKAEIHKLMVDLAERGLAILMISSELPEALGMSDRVGVMRGGALVGTLSRAEATQERVLALALGHGEGAAA